MLVVDLMDCDQNTKRIKQSHLDVDEWILPLHHLTMLLIYIYMHMHLYSTFKRKCKWCDVANSSINDCMLMNSILKCINSKVGLCKHWQARVKKQTDWYHWFCEKKKEWMKYTSTTTLHVQIYSSNKHITKYSLSLFAIKWQKQKW